jgi:hypothetical protein
MLRMFGLILALVAIATPSASGSAGTNLVTVVGRVELPSGAQPVRLVLDGGAHEAISRADGSFSIYGVEPGEFPRACCASTAR